jgi:hypothetical protein
MSAPDGPLDPLHCVFCGAPLESVIFLELIVSRGDGGRRRRVWVPLGVCCQDAAEPAAQAERFLHWIDREP